MNLKVYAVMFATSVALFYVYGAYQYHSGYSSAEADQRQQAQQQLAKQTATVQAGEIKAAEADVAGKEKTEVIYRDVVKYVQKATNTNRGGLGNKCEFDSERVRIKTDAVNNANNIAGFDDSPMQTGNAGR